MNSDQFQGWCAGQHASFLTDGKLQKPLIMGIINVTPNSFSDGGDFLDLKKAHAHAKHLLAMGADLLDIGGEATNPGAVPVSVEEELCRVIPLIESLRQESDVCISIDTSKAKVMEEAVVAGANFINDIKALQGPGSLATAARLQVPVCLMHMRGVPQTMQDNPHYTKHVVEEINDFFEARITQCIAAGIPRENLILDPGFGFGKLVVHNLQMVKHLAQFKRHRLPILLGVSRKHTLGALLEKSVKERLIGGLTLEVVAYLNGVNMIRTHDVNETKQAFTIIDAMMQVE